VKISWENGVVPLITGAYIICIIDLASMVNNICPIGAITALCCGF